MEFVNMKRYVYVRNWCVFVLLIINKTVSFGQEVQYVKGDLSYNFFGYPTLYGLDSATHDKFVSILEEKRPKHKYKSMKKEYEVYHELKKISWQEYPCVQVSLKDSDSAIFIFLDVATYHKVIAKNQEELDKDSLKVSLQLAIVEIIPGYYQLKELENMELVNNPFIHRDKFADMDYTW